MKLHRRTLLALASTGLTGLSLGCKTNERSARPSSDNASPASEAKASGQAIDMAHPVFPSIYVPHGGGPWPFVDVGNMSQGTEALREYLVDLPRRLPARPRALLVVSAHWEEAVPTVQVNEHPPMLYDYSGFPEEAYRLTWPAPGSPETAAEVRSLLEKSSIASAASDARGFDHGTFVVTKLMYPQADIPTFQLSLTSDLSARRLFEIGRALSPLRQNGIVILGSGFSYHNMRGFFRAQAGDPGPIDDSRHFDEWLGETLLASPSERETRLIEWDKAPRARACHPREEHLLPLMVCAGAAAESSVTLPYHEPVMKAHTLAAHFA